jgi:hypothetical protein
MVTVRNYSDAPRSVIGPAVEIARRAFHSAGLESLWIVCDPESCDVPLDSQSSGSRLELFVMPTLRTPPPGAADRHPAGYAMADGFSRPRAYAFYDAAESAADRTLRPLCLILGCILIHEAGHLLGLTHAAHGVMRPNLDGIDMDNAVRGWAFSDDERKRLREAVGGLSHLHTSARR